MNTLTPQQIHDAKRFRIFFAAIPEEMWCVGTCTSGDSHCAYGHLGGADDNFMTLPETQKLWKILHTVTAINDGCIKRYQQPTPRLRILAALDDVIGGKNE